MDWPYLVIDQLKIVGHDDWPKASHHVHIRHVAFGHMPYLNMRAYVAFGHIGPAYNGEAIVCSRHGRSPCRRELILGLRSKPRMSEPRAVRPL